MPKDDGDKLCNDVAVVFGGGGMKAAAFCGAMRAMCEEAFLCHHEVAHCVGTSAGAFFALLLALEWNPARMVELVRDTRFGALVDMPCPVKAVYNLLRHWGVVDQTTIRRWLVHLLTSSGLPNGARATFADLLAARRRHLHVVATNANTRRKRVLGTILSPEVRIVDAVVASMAIPILFQPVEIQGDILIDGGVAENLPESVATLVPEVKRILSFRLVSDRDHAHRPTSLFCFLSSVVYSALDASGAAQRNLENEVVEDEKIRLVRYVLHTGELDTEDWNASEDLINSVIDTAAQTVAARHPWRKDHVD